METIEFHFEGGLAASHEMNFYEASRFQYAASRLLVKLLQFRAEGRFVRNITSTTNRPIVLTAQSKGSFVINVEVPSAPSDGEGFVDVSLATLIAYVSERLLSKVDDDLLRTSVKVNQKLLDRLGIHDVDADNVDHVIQALANDRALRSLTAPTSEEFIERRVAEVGRQGLLDANIRQITKIDPARQQRLISMSAPLFTEMSTALRESADKLEIFSRNDEGRSTEVVYLNRQMAREIEAAVVDKDITPILANVIQYNKETGWGKVRLEEHRQPISFSVPSDLKPLMLDMVTSQMVKKQSYLQTYFVRDKAKTLVRLIVVGILPLPG